MGFLSRPCVAVSAAAENPISKLLSASPLRTVLPERDIVALKTTHSISACVHSLSHHNIHSVPVISAGTCVGFVNALDICRLIAAASPDPSRTTKQELSAFAIAVLKTPLSEITETRNRTTSFAMATMADTASAASAAEILSQGIQSLALYSTVCDAKSISEVRFTGVCSQSDLVRFIYTSARGSRGALAKMYKHPIRSFVGQGLRLQSCWPSSGTVEGMLGFQVTSVNDHATVLVAIQKMALACCDCLAVIDDAGKLTGNISASDLKHCFDMVYF
jgi:CBS domain-containing protein